MPYYSKEYIYAKGLDKLFVGLDDAFINLKYDKKKANKKVKTKKHYCADFEITDIRITSTNEEEVRINGEWIAYKALKNP